MVRDPGALTILASKPLLCHSVVRVLRGPTSKSALTMPVFNDFDFQIALPPQQGANFGDLNFKTVLRSCQLFRDFDFQIAFTARCKFWRHLGQAILRTRPFLGADFASGSHKTMEKHGISRNSYPPKPPHLTHLSCITSARSHLFVGRSSASTLSTVGS